MHTKIIYSGCLATAFTLFLVFLGAQLNAQFSHTAPFTGFAADTVMDEDTEGAEELVELPPRVFFYDLDFAWSEFQELANEINKPFFVDFYASWCAPCKLMDELVYSDPVIAEYVNNDFLAYKVNAEFFEGMDLVEKYRVKEYPTILFFSPDGRIVGRESGLYNAEGFMVLLKKYLDNG